MSLQSLTSFQSRSRFKQNNLEFNKLNLSRSLKHKIIMYRKAIATILVQLSYTLGFVLIKKVIEPSANTNQFITAALITNRIGCQAWCIDQTKIAERDFWKKLILVLQSFIASGISQYQQEVYMFQDELLTETKCPKGFDVLLDLVVMSVAESGLRGIESDDKEEKKIDMHKIIQGMFVVFSQYSKMGIADISIKEDPDKNTHAIQQILMLSIPIIGYRLYHYNLRNFNFIGGVFNPIFADQGVVATFVSKFLSYGLILQLSSLVLHFRIFKINELNSWTEKLFLLWHVGHGMPVKLITETNQERVFFVIQFMNAHAVADGVNESFNELMQSFVSPQSTVQLTLALQIMVLMLYNTDMNLNTIVHSLMLLQDLGSSTGNADFYYTSEYWWEIIIVQYFAQQCMNFFHKQMAQNLDNFTAMMIRMKQDHDSRFQVENDHEDEEQVQDESNNGEDKSDFNQRFNEFRADKDNKQQKIDRLSVSQDSVAVISDMSNKIDLGSKEYKRFNSRENDSGKRYNGILNDKGINIA